MLEINLTSSKWVSLKCFFPISVRLTLSKPLPSVSTNLQQKEITGDQVPDSRKKKLLKQPNLQQRGPVIGEFIHETV